MWTKVVMMVIEFGARCTSSMRQKWRSLRRKSLAEMPNPR
jgi:hypothetical protein